jgi:putative DNA primase/helicase
MKKAGWESCLLKNKQGAYLPNLSNTAAILTHREEWHNVIAFDAFAGVVVKKKQPPWCEDTSPEDDTLGEWTSDDSSRAAVWITREYNCSVYTSVVEEAVRMVAARWEIHPVRDYLNGLTWDKKPRIDDFLVRLAGAQDNRYVRAITKSFLLGAVARIMRPGAKVDTVLILEGAQGVGKSTLLNILASDDWFLDTSFNIGGKDGYQALRRKWIIEFSELDAFSRTDLSRAKAFVSSVKDSYRPPYGRSTLDFPRQCVFAGTINPSSGNGYLSDETGARRFWPVHVGKVDLKAVRAERDQLWAEAFLRYRNNESWYLRDPKLLEAAALEVEERRESDPWEVHFREFIDLNRAIHKRGGVTIPELLTNAVDMPKDRQDRAAQIKAGKALRAIGWTDVQRGTDDVRRYFPAGSLKTTSNPPIKKGDQKGGSEEDLQGGSRSRIPIGGLEARKTKKVVKKAESQKEKR